MLGLMMMNDHHDFERVADEMQIGLLSYQRETRIALLMEVTARILAEAEAMPDTKFLGMLQNRIIAIVSEESVSRGT